MQKTPFDNWPLYASVAVLLLLVWLEMSLSIHQNFGHLVYAMDDPYIHMAIAKNFSQFGVWGVTRYGFTPASSSLLWTLLLSLTFYLGGVHQIVPLLMNLVFSVLVLVAADSILRFYKLGVAARFIALLGIILLIPLPTLVLSGMEPILQTLLTILAAFLAARLISGESPDSARRDAVALLLLAPLVTAARFEGMFVIAAISALLLLGRRWLYTLAFTVSGFLPVLINGVISKSKGWFWFPTSVLLKASLPDFHSPVGFFFSLLDPIYVTLHESMHILVLMFAVLLFYIIASGRGSGPAESRQIMGAILVLIGLAHLEFVGAGPLYRYDSSWCTLALIFLAVQLPVVVPRWPSPLSLETWTAPRNLACAVLTLLLFFPLARKGGRLLWYLPQCTNNVFEQQYQMGLFVRQYYQNSTVALNDIGAVNFLADIHCLDLWGLGNAEVAHARRNNSYQADDIDRISKETGARIAIIYDNWFPGRVPPQWIRVGRWTIRENVLLGGDTVSFYALDPTEAQHLSESLSDFSAQLPPDVIQRGQ